MSMIKRLDRVDVATADLAGAAETWRNNFGFAVAKSADGESVSVKIGGAEIRLAAGPGVAAQIEKSGEGMIALWLEADDVDVIAAALRRAGIEPGAIRREGGRRVLVIDPKAAHQVPLFIFDRRS
jgi:Glyoxalase/Bleomycin resistance protein/Dioxygenase superfamily